MRKNLASIYRPIGQNQCTYMFVYCMHGYCQSRKQPSSLRMEREAGSVVGSALDPLLQCSVAAFKHAKCNDSKRVSSRVSLLVSSPLLEEKCYRQDLGNGSERACDSHTCTRSQEAALSSQCVWMIRTIHTHQDIHSIGEGSAETLLCKVLHNPIVFNATSLQ